MMNSSDRFVYVVDDDPDIRKALTRSLGKRGYIVSTFESAQQFLDAYQSGEPGCLVLDVRMPDMSGLELQAILKNKGMSLPIIFVTGHGDIPMSVRAIKDGAVDFLEKPYLVEKLMERIDEAIDRDFEQHELNAQELAIKRSFELLTPRERDVMSLLVAGAADTSSKNIARQLSISHRTVDDHRSKVMAKMQARSLSELVDMAKICSIYRP